MADGDESPDTVALASDFLKAMSAYRELQTELTGARIQPWQGQWAVISSAINPIQEQVDKAAVGWNAVRERWRIQATAMQYALVRGCVSWGESKLALEKELAGLGPR